MPRARRVAVGTDLDVASAIKAIDGASQIWLACHIRPDADALGSMLAFAVALERQRPGVLAGASFGDDPFTVPGILHFLPGQEALRRPAECPPEPELMITFDAASIDRLGLLAGPAAAAGALVVLDHHASNTGFGSVNLVDPAAAATAVVAAGLIDAMGITLTQDIALGLYAGLVTDTGCFKFSATTPAVHELAARLLATGIDPGAVSRELYDRAPFGYLRMLSAATGRAVLEPAASQGLGVVWTTVTRADRARAGLPLEAAESVIDVVRKTDEAEVAVVLKEADDGQWQASVRSKSVVDVGAACTALGGGGHARAAGFSFSGHAGEAVAALLRELDRQ